MTNQSLYKYLFIQKVLSAFAILKRLEELTTKTDPLGKTSSYTYDSIGRLTSKTDRNGSTINYTYTPTDKIEHIAYPDSTGVAYTYNQHDRLTQMNDAFGATNYGYDAAGRLTSISNWLSQTVTYTYDAAGNITTITYPGSKTVTYTYDQLNRLTTVTNWLSQTATYTYDEAGRVNTFTNFNGIITTYQYDNANRLTGISDSSAIVSYAFTLDANGNRTTITQTEPLTIPIPASSNTAYTYNYQKNRLLTVGWATPTAFTYDDEGQLNSGYGKNFGFDYEHRLTGTSTDRYYYHGNGNRLLAERNTIATRYIYDAAGNLIAEADGNNNITKYYIYGLGLIAMVTDTGSLYTYHFNATGSTIAMTDINKNIVNAYQYDPFGNIANQSETVTQPFKFVGQYGVMTEPNGFYYMKARYYDPNVGRFISEDPIGFDGGDVNLMGYVLNNPTNLVDPNGLDVTIYINRTTYTQNSIVGTIMVTSTVTDSFFLGYTLENRTPPNPNLPVPSGIYSAFVRSDHTPNRIELIGVPNASNVQIHTGNSPSDVIGCFAVGTSTSTDWVGNSNNAMNSINNIISADGSGNITVITTGK